VAAQSGRIVAVLQDLGGPKIRTGRLEGGGPLPLETGQTLELIAGDEPGRPGRISTAYAELVRSARPGDRLLLDDGKIELRVVASGRDMLTAEVVHGGALGERKGINAPGVKLPASAITEKDARDLRFGLALGVDLVAVSFVQTAEDMQRARSIVWECGRTGVPLIAKLERPEAISNLDAVLEASDGVMVARGDLGLETPLEQVPRLQKEVTRRARMQGVPVIVATQVLESMRTEPRPTRAEVSDAANAVYDGVDGVMLSGETAMGAHPALAVETLDRIITEAEAMGVDAVPLARGQGMHMRALCEAAVTLARGGHAEAIVAVTRAGATARLLSALRPDAPVYAATEREETARALMLLRGVVPVVVEIGPNVDLSAIALERQVMAHRQAPPPGAVVVFVRVNPDLGRRDSNFLKFYRIGAGRAE
jgi:pyruvate kinase